MSSPSPSPSLSPAHATPDDWRRVALDSPHLWQRAASMAARFHNNQYRKDGRTPYVAHPMRVAMIVRDVFGFGDETVLAAALLHDLIEDTRADYDDILTICGAPVADLVAALTKDMRAPESKREPAYDRCLAAAPWQARLIKLADVYDNICDALPGRQRDKAIEKAHRALDLCKDDAPLAGSTHKVLSLISRYSASTTTSSSSPSSSSPAASKPSRKPRPPRAPRKRR